MKIPSNKQWAQTNTGNVLGVLHETHNMNLSALGEIGLSRKAVALISNDGDFEELMALVYFDGNYIAVTDDSAFEGDLSGASFEIITGGNGFGPETDAIVFNGYLYTTKSTSLSRWSGSAWNNSLDTYTTGYPHPLCVFDSQPTYKLAIGNVNQVETLDTSHNANATVLSLPSNYVVTCLAYRNSYLYVGTKEVNGGEAAIFLWNGDGSNAQYKIDVGASWVYSMTPYRGSIAAVTNEGEVLLLNGSEVQQLAVFPVFHSQGSRWEEGNAIRGKVYPRGMVSQGDTLYINIEGKCDSGHIPEMKSGVWAFEPRTGLTHLTAATTDLWVEDVGVALSNNTFTASTTHNLSLGDAVMFTALSGVTGISSSVLYYAIPVDATTFKIAASLGDASAGNYINITGTLSGGSLHYIPNTDKGNLYNATSGAIALTNYLDSGKYPLWATDIIFGSSTRNPAGTTKNVLCVLSPQNTTGSFTLQRIFSENVTQTWKSLYAFVSGLLTTGEKAVVKVATSDKRTRHLSGSWADATTFNTTDSAAFNFVEVGDEMVIVDGAGQGRSAHVTATDISTMTLSVTVDESVGVDAASSRVYFTKFRKIGEITSARESASWSRNTIDMKNNWVQPKVELRGFESTVSMLELTSSVDKSAL